MLSSGDSWAYLITDTDQTGRAWQGGSRPLWDEVEAAQSWYEAHGDPGVTRFGLTVKAGYEAVWLDHPGQVLHEVHD